MQSQRASRTAPSTLIAPSPHRGTGQDLGDPMPLNTRRPAGGCPARLWSLLAAAALALATASSHAGDVLEQPEQGQLRPGEYRWMPQLAPRGPVLIVVSLQQQQAYVYRNGIRIALASVSTGKAGYETPTGVFSILQKRREHFSNLYDNAPMPYMQRLTWDGIALHAGKVPGYPASHGCVRLPYEFSEKLFGITEHGMTVVVTDSIPSLPVTGAPGLFSPSSDSSGIIGTGSGAASEAPWSWRPERSPVGPLNLLLSTRDRQMVVLRDGIEIGWAPIEFRDVDIKGTYVYTLLESTPLQRANPVASLMVTDRPALNWLAVPIADSAPQGSLDLRDAFAQRRIVLPESFARHVYDQLAPGDTLVITDESTRGRALVLPATLLEANDPPAGIQHPGRDAGPIE